MAQWSPSATTHYCGLVTDNTRMVVGSSACIVTHCSHRPGVVFHTKNSSAAEDRTLPQNTSICAETLQLELHRDLMQLLYLIRMPLASLYSLSHTTELQGILPNSLDLFCKAFSLSIQLNCAKEDRLYVLKSGIYSFCWSAFLYILSRHIKDFIPWADMFTVSFLLLFLKSCENSICKFNQARVFTADLFFAISRMLTGEHIELIRTLIWSSVLAQCSNAGFSRAC